ncbi:hypothetical protein ES703_13889 [subsurface metagenome]
MGTIKLMRKGDVTIHTYMALHVPSYIAVNQLPP